MRASHYAVHRADFIEPVASGALAADGTFRVEVDPGVYMVSLAGVDHANEHRRLLVERDVRVEGNLGTYRRGDFGATLAVRGEYLDAAGKTVGATAREAKRVSDGHYRLALVPAPEGATKLRWQIGIAEGRTANAPGGESWTYDGGGDFWSVAPIPKGDALEIDLAALPPSGMAATLAWSGEDATSVALREHHERWERERSRWFESLATKDGQILTPTKEQQAAMQQVALDARKEVDAESDERVRVLLRGLHFMTFYSTRTPDENRAELRWVIDNVPTNDARIGLALGLGNAIFVALQDADAEFVATAEAWLDRVARENPEPAVVLDALTILLYFADQRRDETRIDELYARVSTEGLRGTYRHQHLARAYDPERILKRGKALPDFDFAALGQPGKRVTKADREGKLYLLEFWATWCGPCVAEMPKLHATYAAVNGARKGKGKGDAGLRKLKTASDPRVEFVFVSLDGTENDVTEFRRKYWSMPWVHAFVGGGLEPELMKKFGFSGVPTAILVDETGTILEYGAALRNDQLRKTLDARLAASSQPQR